MTKVMRKYQKWILAIGGSLLMVGWLLQGVMGQMAANRGNEVVALLGNRKIKGEEFGKASLEYHFLKTIAPAIVTAGAGIENDAHFFLLSHEAQNAGLVGDVRDGQSYADQLEKDEARFLFDMQAQRRMGNMAYLFEQFEEGKQLRQQINQMVAARFSTRDKAAAENRMTPEDSDRALARLRGILRLMKSNNIAARMSDRYTAVSAKRLLDSAVADIVVVPAGRLASTIPAPTEEELRSHFEKYRAIEAAKSDDGIGYVQPPRVKLEWITLDRNVMAAAVVLDPIEVRKRFEQNRARFPGEFAVEKTRVEEEMKSERASRAMDAAEKAVRLEVSQALEPLPKDGAAYRVLPADWEEQRPRFEAIAQRIVESVRSSVGITIPPPKVEIRAASWLTQRDIRDLPGFGSSGVSQSAQYTPIDQLVFAARELAPARERGVQKGVPFIALPSSDGEGHRYFFTVIDTRGQSPADALDEVREKAISDWKRLKAYDKLMEEAEANRILAAAEGLDAIVQLFPGEGSEKPLEVQKRVRFSKLGSEGGAAASEKPVLDAAAQAAMLVDPLVLPSDESALARTFAAGAPKSLSLVIGQVLAQQPVTIESLRTINEKQLPVLRTREMMDIKLSDSLANPFSFESLKSRLRFKPVRETEEDEAAKKTASN